MAAAAELPSFYGQKTRDGTIIQHPSQKLHAQSSATDMAPAINSPSILPNKIGHSSQDRPANLRQRPTSSRSQRGNMPRKVSSRNSYRKPSSTRRQPGASSLRQEDRDYGEDEEESGESGSMDTEEEYRRRHMRRIQLRRKIKEKHQADVIPLRIPWTKWMHSDAKNHFIAFIGEFIGTTMFLFFAFAGTQVANIGFGNSIGNSSNGSSTNAGESTAFNPTIYLYTALSFGFSLVVNAWIFYRISGGLFNPSVTMALVLLKALHPGRACFIFVAQLTGACFASYLVKVMFPIKLNVATTLASGTSITQGIFIEALCTAELVFTIIMLAKEKHKATFLAPVGIGLALFIGELVAVYYTGGSLNPARSFGPAAVTRTFSHNDWVYWVGPLLGSFFAVVFYWFIKVLEYEMANPGQDGDAKNDPTQNPDHEIARVVQERADEVEELKVVEEEGGVEALADLADGDSVVGLEFGQRDGQISEKVSEPSEGDGAETIESPQASPTGLLAKMRSRKSSKSEVGALPGPLRSRKSSKSEGAPNAIPTMRSRKSSKSESPGNTIPAPLTKSPTPPEDVAEKGKGKEE